MTRLTQTLRGIRQPAKAVEALRWDTIETTRKFGQASVAWGDVHRVRRGNVDVPVGGYSGTLSCFRALSYEEQPDGKRAANSGDGWVMAVEFGARVPRAYSILAYGQSTDPVSPNHDDQAAMFARSEFKPVWFTADDVLAHTKRQDSPAPCPHRHLLPDGNAFHFSLVVYHPTSRSIPRCSISCAACWSPPSPSPP